MAVIYLLVDENENEAWIGQRDAGSDYKDLRVYTATKEVSELKEFLEKNDGKLVRVIVR